MSGMSLMPRTLFEIKNVRDVRDARDSSRKKSLMSEMSEMPETLLEKSNSSLVSEMSQILCTHPRNPRVHVQ